MFVHEIGKMTLYQNDNDSIDDKMTLALHENCLRDTMVEIYNEFFEELLHMHLYEKGKSCQLIKAIVGDDLSSACRYSSNPAPSWELCLGKQQKVA